MKKAISTWSFPVEMDLAARMSLAKSVGFEGLEVSLDDDPDGSLARRGFLTWQQMEETAPVVKQAAEEIGVGIPSVAIGIGWQYQLTADDPAQRAQAVEVHKQGIRAARRLGLDDVLIVPGVVDACFAPVVPPVPYDVCYRRAVESVRELLPVAEENRVRLGLEPVWNMFLLSPLEWVSFVDGFGSPWAKVYMDLGNVLITGYPEQWIRILGSRINRVHVKDYKRSVADLDAFVRLLEGDVNFPACMAALREVGYDSWLTAEIMPISPYAPTFLVQESALAMDLILAM